MLAAALACLPNVWASGPVGERDVLELQRVAQLVESDVRELHHAACICLNSLASADGLHLALPALAVLALSAGCSMESVIDLENARNEAVFVPAEVVGTLGFAVAQAQNYGERAAVAQNAFSVGNSPDEEGCSAVSVTDDILDDGLGSVLFDFQACPGQAGRVHVDQESVLEIPEGWEQWNEDGPGGDFPDDFLPQRIVLVQHAPRPRHVPCASLSSAFWI